MMNSLDKITVIFLHGFTGCGDEWLPIVKNIEDICDPLTINLVGHGTTEPPDDITQYTIDAQIERILSIADKVSLEKFVLAGYSMGGRIALNFAIGYPDRLCGLILESSTAGIENNADRKNRIDSDEELAQYLESNTIETFVDKWINLPLFASQSRLSSEIKERIRMQKLHNSKTGLINTLRAAGSGQMTPLWNKLCELTIPVLLITGSIDKKFTELNQRMESLLPECKHVIIEDAGHNVHLEKPEVYSMLIKEYIKAICN